MENNEYDNEYDNEYNNEYFPDDVWVAVPKDIWFSSGGTHIPKIKDQSFLFSEDKSDLIKALRAIENKKQKTLEHELKKDFILFYVPSMPWSAVEKGNPDVPPSNCKRINGEVSVEYIFSAEEINGSEIGRSTIQEINIEQFEQAASDNDPFNFEYCLIRKNEIAELTTEYVEKRIIPIIIENETGMGNSCINMGLMNQLKKHFPDVKINQDNFINVLENFIQNSHELIDFGVKWKENAWSSIVEHTDIWIEFSTSWDIIKKSIQSIGKETILKEKNHPAISFLLALSDSMNTELDSRERTGLQMIGQEFGWEKDGIHVFETMKNYISNDMRYNFKTTMNTSFVLNLAEHNSIDWNQKIHNQKYSYLELFSECLPTILEKSEKSNINPKSDYWKKTWSSVIESGNYLPYIFDEQTKIRRDEIKEMIPIDDLRKLDMLKSIGLPPNEIQDIMKDKKSESIDVFDSVPIDPTL